MHEFSHMLIALWLKESIQNQKLQRIRWDIDAIFWEFVITETQAKQKNLQNDE